MAAGVGNVMPTAVHLKVFLKLDGVEGKSTDSKRKGEIDVLAWELGIVPRGLLRASCTFRV
jgi:type VI protein secretion system component Hcp